MCSKDDHNNHDDDDDDDDDDDLDGFAERTVIIFRADIIIATTMRIGHIMMTTRKGGT